MAKRVSILGSCITRDIFRLFPAEGEVASYHSRSSLVSLMSPAFPLDERRLEFSCNFARKVVLADFRKTFLGDLRAAAPDFLIIDLMSERFDLLHAAGSYVTLSWDLLNSGFDPRTGYEFERLSRESEVVHAAWRDKSREFARALRKQFAGLTVVLHRAHWTEHYRDQVGIRPFSREWREYISRRNEMLDEYYAQLERELPGVVTIEPRQAYVADPDHRWGLGSSHYEHAYYGDLALQLRAISSRPSRTVCDSRAIAA